MSGINVSKVVIMDESIVVMRGIIEVDVLKMKGYISCDVFFMSDKVVMEIYLGFISRVDDVEFSYEVVIGKIREEEFFYFMSCGLDEEKVI